MENIILTLLKTVYNVSEVLRLFSLKLMSAQTFVCHFICSQNILQNNGKLTIMWSIKIIYKSDQIRYVILHNFTLNWVTYKTLFLIE